MRLFVRLIGIVAIWWFGFCVHGALTVTFIRNAGFWRGLLASGLLSASCLFLVTLINEVRKARQESLSYLLNRYGKMVADNARRRCRHDL